MAVLTIEDAQGSVEVVVFPEAFQRAAALTEVGALVLVRGKVEGDDEAVRVIAAEILPIDTVRERLVRDVAIRLKAPGDRHLFEALGEVFSRHRGDRRVSFEIEVPGQPADGQEEGAQAPRRLRVTADVSAQIRVRPSAALVAEVEQIVGAGSVSLR
jgi:DNA polymerase-3 subunit alpha